jgi:hypothetical protein
MIDCLFIGLAGNTPKKSSQNVRTCNKPFDFLGPDQDDVVVNDIVKGPFARRFQLLNNVTQF